jgi:hypothetical protein
MLIGFLLEGSAFAPIQGSKDPTADLRQQPAISGLGPCLRRFDEF